jgi:hypothetical protein
VAYFRLDGDCERITGRNGTVVYDIGGGRIFLFDDEASQVLAHCESRNPLKEEWLGGPEHQFLRTLAKEGLGRFHSYPVHVDKLFMSSPLVQKSGMLAQKPVFNTATWSITDRCDQDCHFCPGSAEDPLWQACRSCFRREGIEKDQSLLNNPEPVIEELAALGFHGLHIRGGNPLLEWERLTNILGAVNKFSTLNITITTVGTGAQLTDILSLYDISPRLTLNIVLLGFDDEHVEGCLNKDDVAVQQFALLDALRKNELAFLITVIVSDKAPVQRDSVTNRIFERWKVIPQFAEFYPMPKSGDAFQFTTIQNGKRLLYRWRDPNQFFQLKENASCMFGGMEITTGGTITPCAGCNHQCGKIVDKGLSGGLRGDQLYDVWGTSKSDIDQCKDCALRVACVDCLAADMLGEKNEKVRASYCPVMFSERSLFDDADLLEGRGFVYRLSLKRGLETCPV